MPLYPRFMAVGAEQFGRGILFHSQNPFSRLRRHLASTRETVSSSPTSVIMATLSGRQPKTVVSFVVIVVVSALAGLANASAQGEPAADFLKRLRAAGYFDTAVSYLDRLNKYPGVDPELISAIGLEKAHTYIEAAVASRSAKDRDQFFVLAEQSLNSFLQGGDHPRTQEARSQLGKLQMVQATQYMLGEPDDAQREKARESYLAAAKTFDAIVETLKGKLTEMRGERIDPRKEPDKAALRDQYQFEYLQSQLNAADVRKLAAKTYKDPGKDGKALLEQARDQFQNLTSKYSRYVQGAVALSHLGQVYHELGDTEKALDNYMRMLESPDADPLRDGKFQSASGLIQLRLAETPPNYQDAIDRCKQLAGDIRPNERLVPSVQQLRLDLAKAYLAKSRDTEKQKPTDIKRAESEGRQLLLAASKVPGPHLSEAKELLSGMGIEQATADLPKAEPPQSLEDALDKARELLTASENLQSAIKELEAQPETDELKEQIAQMQKDLAESQSIAVQILRWGLAMAGPGTNHETLNQARSYLAYMLVQGKRHRDASVVGQFLARNAPGTDIGLQGGLMALNALQNLLVEVPDDENDGLISQLEKLGDFMSATWPDDPRASAAQGLRVRLMLTKENWLEARKLIDKMPDGAEKASLQRLLGQLLWNHSLQLRRDGNEEEANKILVDAAKDLRSGLDGISGALVEGEAIKAALVLSKIYLKQDKHAEALAVLDDEKYGPVKLVDKLGDGGSDTLLGDLYSTELKVLVQQMLATDGDIAPLLDRATTTMESLRKAYQGADGQVKLTSIYKRLAFDVREALDSATPAKKAKLIQVFQVLLERIAGATDDKATLRWSGQTLMDMGEAAMPPTDVKAQGQALTLISAAAKTFADLRDDKDLTTSFLYARANRLTGKYKDALDELEKILKQKPMMLDAQIEAAQAYESWAAELNPKFAPKAYNAALSGGRPNAKGENTIWGWGKISKQTNRDPKYRDVFFEARYHIALTRFLMGKSMKDDKIIAQAARDITSVEALFPDLGGQKQRDKFDLLLKEIQKAKGEKPVGLPPQK